jgi:hypothetical protein
MILGCSMKTVRLQGYAIVMLLMEASLGCLQLPRKETLNSFLLTSYLLAKCIFRRWRSMKLINRVQDTLLGKGQKDDSAGSKFKIKNR